MSTTLTVRIDDQTKNRLDQLAKATSCSKSYLVAHAIENLLKENEWQIKKILDAVEKTDRKDARFVDHEDVSKWLDSWGTDKEEKPPQCK